MHIEWQIIKKRGNFRPILRYTITLTEFEVGLGMPAVRMQSCLPKPPDAGWTYCWPGENERIGEEPLRDLKTPETALAASAAPCQTNEPRQTGNTGTAPEKDKNHAENAGQKAQPERPIWTPTEWHLLMTPSHRTGKTTEELRLPWRASNRYPEVEAAFTALRTAFEAALAETAASSPMDERGTLETSADTRKVIAPAFAAERILRAVRS